MTKDQEINKKPIYICILLVIIGIIFIITGFNMKKNKDGNQYKQEISEYLEKKYEKKFDIQFLRKGYKKIKHMWMDASPVYYGHDKDIIEYLYTFSPEDNHDIICYIACWYNKNTNEIEISEISNIRQIFGIFSFKNNVENYGQILSWYKSKEGVKERIETYVGNDYIVDWNYYGSALIVISERKLKTIILEDEKKFIDLYNYMAILDRDNSIILKYKDYKIEIRDGYGHIGKNSFKDAEEIVEYFNKN